MRLDWDFYHDDWLIDRVPDNMEIVIEEHPDGIVINPPSLTCFFGANPIYLYGTGKLLHEVMMTPDGMMVYPDFLQRPGFEFVEEISFNASFEESVDFHGNIVNDMHVGMVNAKKYLDGIFNKIYGTPTGYAGIRTPSTDLRDLNVQDFEQQAEGIIGFQMYETILEMKNDGCDFYCKMRIVDGTPRLHDEINDTYMDIISPGAVIETPGLYGNVTFLRYSYVLLPSYIESYLAGSQFQIFLILMIDFRPGIIIDMGATNNASEPNTGFSVTIHTTGVEIIANDGTFIEILLYHNFDFSIVNSIQIERVDTDFSLFVNGLLANSQNIEDVGNILFNGTQGYLSYSTRNSTNSSAGDIEELAIYSNRMSDENMDRYATDPVVFNNAGGAAVIEYNNIPVGLSYDLTYNNPARIFVPNFFGGKIRNIYFVDSANMIEINDYGSSENIKSIVINNGFRIDNVVTYDLEDHVDFTIGEKMPVLTKLTSDTHIPLKIYMKFKIPEFWDRKTIFNIALILRPVGKMIRYTYEKYKTGEFI